MNVTFLGTALIGAIVTLFALISFKTVFSTRPRNYANSGSNDLLKVFGIIGLVLLGGAFLSYNFLSLSTVQTTQIARPYEEVQKFESGGEKIAQTTIPVTEESLDTSSGEPIAEGPPLLNPEIGEGEIVASQTNLTEAEPASATATVSSSSQVPPAIAFRSDISIIALAGLILIVFLIAGGIWIAHYKQHWTLENFQYSAGQFLWVVPMLGVVVWISAIYAPFFSFNPLSRDAAYSAAEAHFNRYQDDTEVETEGQFQVATKGISPWVTNGKTNYQEKVLVPVHGGWRESQSEAENYANRQALRVLKNDFESSFPEAEDWRIELALNDLNAVQRMEVESRRFTLAGNDVQMYRTHLQVELSDTVRGKIVDAWTPRLRTFRTTILQVLMVLLMVVFFAIGGTLSIDMKTHGAYSRWIRFASLIIVFAAGMGAYMMKESLLFRYLI